MKKLFTLFMLAASFTSFSQHKVKDPYVGLEEKSLIAKCGKPTSIEHSGDTGEVIIYKQGWDEYWEKRKLNGPCDLLAPGIHTFKVDKDGKVASWKFKSVTEPAK